MRRSYFWKSGSQCSVIAIGIVLVEVIAAAAMRAALQASMPAVFVESLHRTIGMFDG